MNDIGTRVIRGPDWTGRNEDGGDGSLGTVINVYNSVGKVKVIWDFGNQGVYKAGGDSKHELLIYDNAPTGVTHECVTCNCCSIEPITGIRWKCRECYDFDICTDCYMNSKHDKNHRFLRYLNDSSTLFPISSQNNCRVIQIHGILPGASVTRGINWERANEDGGNNNEGIVEKITNWGQNSHRGGALVTWSTGFRTDYRVGGDGYVDLVVIGESKVYRCISEHLPVLDVIQSQVDELKIGDKVRIIEDIRTVEKLLTEMKNWSPAIEKYMEEEGTIIGFSRSMNHLAIVQYTNTQKWFMYKCLLTKTHSFKKGDIVRIINQSNDKMEKHQENHGGWASNMTKTKGKVGIVVQVDEDGDLNVRVMDNAWTYSPVCCQPIDITSISKEEKADIDQYKEGSASSSLSGSTNSSGQMSNFNDINEEITDALAQILQMPRKEQGLVAAAAQGDILAVENILKTDKLKIDSFVENKTALQMACYKGHDNIIVFLIKHRASINLADDEGDTPLHLAVSGEKFESVKLLCKYEVDINVLNKKKQSPFHLAVYLKNCNISKYLMEQKCDINTQDEDGDTPMHDVIDDPDDEIFNLMLSCNILRLDIQNKMGLTAIHFAVEKCISKSMFKQLITKVKHVEALKTSVEGYTPLHIAAENDNRELASVLIHQENCNVDATDNDGRTALHLAAKIQSEPMIDILLFANATINKQDNEGNTPAHLSLINVSPDKTTKKHGRQSIEDVVNGIVYILTRHGADLSIKNKKGKIVLDYVSVKDTRGLLMRISKSIDKRKPSAKESVYPEYWCEMTPRDRCIRVKIDAHTTGASEEYKNIIRQFSRSAGNRRPMKVERIQNIDGWEAYVVKKKSMERTYGTGCTNERFLFHGTKPDIVDRIVAQGLDIRELGNGLYGDGAYLAAEAKLADGYTVEDKANNDLRYMFVCKVLVGKITQGIKGMKKPPVIDNQNLDVFYDTAVDEVNKPKIFVVFNNNQCYQGYIISYK